MFAPKEVLILKQFSPDYSLSLEVPRYLQTGIILQLSGKTMTSVTYPWEFSTSLDNSIDLNRR